MIKYLIKINILLAALLLIFTCGCGRLKKDYVNYEEPPISLKQFDILPGADLSVPPELGGNGFKGDGWKTNNNYNSTANINAVKGGSIIISLSDFPATLRPYGKDANNSFNAFPGKLFY